MPVAIRRADADLAADRRRCERIATITNAAYAIGEAGMWRPGTVRVGPDEIARLAGAGELLVAEADDAVLGCVRVHPLDGTTWGFGMLAVDPDRQGGGIGHALVDAAEASALDAGATTMQLELLTPVAVQQDSKVRLAAWYRSRGYTRIGRDALQNHHPELVPLLAVECTYDVWQKPLRSR